MATRHRHRQEKAARDSSSHVESRQLATQPSGPRANYFLIATVVWLRFFALGRAKQFLRPRIRSDIRSDCRAGSPLIVGDFLTDNTDNSQARRL